MTDFSRDLAAVGALTAELATVDVDDQADRALDWTRDALNVEASEIFLLEPGAQDMLLSYFRGESESAFSEIGRFPAGSGFPGLILDKGESITTSDLSADNRYLREQVKADGFHSYVCVPLVGADGVVGAVNIAARDPELDTERAEKILNWVGASITRTLENASLRAQLASLTPFATMRISDELQTLALEMLERMMEVGGASSGQLRLFHPDVRGIVHRVNKGSFCEEVPAGDSTPCPALAGDLGIALFGSREDWPQQCRHLSGDADVVQCLPLISGGKSVGLVQLHYDQAGPRPPTKHIAVLHSVAVQAAEFIKQAWDSGSAREQSAPESDSGGAREAAATDVPVPVLDMHCFGSFNLALGGHQIPPGSVQRRGAITLLKMLATHDGQAVSRDVMAEALWPDSEPDAVVNRIHVLIHALRQVIEPPGSGRRRSWTFIRNDGDRYYLNPDAPYRSDVREFRRLATDGHNYEVQGDSAGAARSYESALALYTGDLLEDEPYAEWCWPVREHLRETALNVAVKLAVHNFRQQEFEKSISFYRRALRIDSLREEIHRGLIATLIAADRRAEAIRQYEICRDALKAELDVVPLPETRRLIEQIPHGLG